MMMIWKIQRERYRENPHQLVFLRMLSVVEQRKLRATNSIQVLHMSGRDLHRWVVTLPLRFRKLELEARART